MCQQWRHSFEQFIADMGPRPSDTHSIDRINCDGNYEPGNVRWATREEQARNTRRNVLIAFNGVTQCLSDWCKQLGIVRSTAERRIKRGLHPLIGRKNKRRA